MAKSTLSMENYGSTVNAQLEEGTVYVGTEGVDDGDMVRLTKQQAKQLGDFLLAAADAAEGE